MTASRTPSAPPCTRRRAAWWAAALAGCCLATVVPAMASPVSTLLVWDNDRGLTLCDPDLVSAACVPVGTEVGLVRAVINNGSVPEVVTTLPTDLSPYAGVYITLGWSDGNEGAGQITVAEQTLLATYILAGHPVFLQGNDFAADYKNTELLDLFGAVFNGGGSATGNVSQLIGRPGTFAQGMVFGYPFGTPSDFSVDDVLPGGVFAGDILFDDQNGPGKAMSSPTESGSPRGKTRDGGGPITASTIRGRTVLFTTVFGAMPDGLPPSTKDMLMGRVLGDLGLLVTPVQPSTWGNIKALYTR